MVAKLCSTSHVQYARSVLFPKFIVFLAGAPNRMVHLVLKAETWCTLCSTLDSFAQ